MGRVRDTPCALIPITDEHLLVACAIRHVIDHQLDDVARWLHGFLQRRLHDLYPKQMRAMAAQVRSALARWEDDGVTPTCAVPLGQIADLLAGEYEMRMKESRGYQHR